MTNYVPTYVDLSGEWHFLLGTNVAGIEHRMYRDSLSPEHYVVRRVSLLDGDSLTQWKLMASSIGEAIDAMKELQAEVYGLTVL